MDLAGEPFFGDISTSPATFSIVELAKMALFMMSLGSVSQASVFSLCMALYTPDDTGLGWPPASQFGCRANSKIMAGAKNLFSVASEDPLKTQS